MKVSGKRVRQIGEECPRCGAAAGESCRNYAGRNKAACRYRPPPPRPGEVSAQPVQRDLPGIGGAS